jgi:hypothetical protein
MIQVHATEQRTMIEPGKAPLTILREVTLKNGKGRKTIKVLRGTRVISTESSPLGTTERRRVHGRKFVRGLYKPLERRTRRALHGRNV